MKKTTDLLRTSPSKHFCPNCGKSKAMMTDSRPTSDPSMYFRRRRYACAECNYRWTTLETVVGEAKGGVDTQKRRALEFVRGVEALAREKFGNEVGTFIKPGRK